MKCYAHIVISILFSITLLVSTSIAGGRFLVKEKVIIDSKTKVVWLRDANMLNEYVSKKEAENHIKKMNKENYGGYNNWWFPGMDDFENSFDCRVYKKGYKAMEKYYLGKYKEIGFKNVRAAGYLTCSYTDNGFLDSRVYWDTNPTECTGVPNISNTGYFWPIAKEK